MTKEGLKTLIKNCTCVNRELAGIYFLTFFSTGKQLFSSFYHIFTGIDW